MQVTGFSSWSGRLWYETNADTWNIWTEYPNIWLQGFEKKKINKVKFGLNWSKNFSADWATLLTNMEETHPCSFRHKEEEGYDDLPQETVCQKS